MKIDWELHVPFTDHPPLSLVADACCLAEGVSVPCGVHLIITDDEEIRSINAAYRGIDRSTDVLSFPSVNYPADKTAGSCEKLLRMEYDPEEDACILGDVILSAEHARAQAAEYGHSVTREICYLFAHALFHLMGYDHMIEDDRVRMRAMEEKAMQMTGIVREETALVSDEDLMALAWEARKFSYSPYSHYAVGAALLCKDGRVYQGCNIENAAFGITNCAERTALFKAVSEGETEFAAIAIAAEGAAPYPCGACRQALNEFAPDLRVLVTWDNGAVDKTTLPDLLPHGFGPKSLENIG